ncbi:hypothetical protein TSUD_311680 [Trifolium subterraneum]|uniref:Malic enzyme n=1 Tax=Trifolium subterraneum TaxID=3900 RepID=A0A2Z6M470_TRISU|nr:hypothetical protein TSUD_311680 [Trifolium subterraneum]
MYVAAVGINPQKILPFMLDFGTNNQKLLDDHLYLGVRQPRLEGEEYLSIVDEFMEAVHARWPKAIETLKPYRQRFCMFNDDIQGTTGVALAGLLGTVRAQGRPLSDFVKQKIVIVGAGSAGHGVLNMAVQAVSRMPGSNLDPTAVPFARNPRDLEGLAEGASIIEVVKKVKPHVLLGLSGVGGVFNEQLSALLLMHLIMLEKT